MKRFTYLSICVIVLYFLPSLAWGQVPHPSNEFGFMPGDDYQLATYDMMLKYYEKLGNASERVLVTEIGKTVLGQPLLLLIISSKENLENLDTYKETSEKLARAKIDQEEAQRLAQSGKAVVWIDGGLHATEVAHAQATSLLAYKVATEESREMQQIRENTILLLMPVMNPDGLDIVANWYKSNRGTPFETTRPPILYHHYVGHDNNRDWFMNNMPESEAVTRVLYNEWYPQFVLNHHQTGPSWARIFIPPFSDPVNPRIHPGVTTGVNMVGSAMANRFAMEKMPGAASRVVYSMWWNGGMRTVPYFHNMIGLLTEVSHATPTPRFYDPDSIPKMIAARRGSGHPTNGTNIFYPYPYKGGESHFSEPVAYMQTASMALLRLASDMKEHWLMNIYQMGLDQLKMSEDGDFAYIIPAGQWLKDEAVNLVNLLRLGGIEVHTTKEDLTIEEKTYPSGSFLIYTKQAFRPYLEDLMEKQEYPSRIRNGQPETPYDLAGWTLPMQMGVEFGRIGQEMKIDAELLIEDAVLAKGRVSERGNFGFSFSPRTNNSIKLINQLQKDGYKLWKAEDGNYIVEIGSGEKAKVESLGSELGVDLTAQRRRSRNAVAVVPTKIGLYKSWQANMDEGWTRYLLTEYGFDFDTLHDADIVNKDLSNYHAIVLPSQSSNGLIHGHRKGTYPEKYTGGLGLQGVMALRNYVEKGGSLVALDASSDFVIDQFALPLRNVVRNVSSRQFFIPGSLVRLAVDTTHVLATGMQAQTAASFVRSRSFERVRLSRRGEGGITQIPEVPLPEVEVIARYAKEDILMSGWAMGENRYLKDKIAVARMSIGVGHVVLFGFRPQFRAQPRATYKLFFNTLLGI